MLIESESDDEKRGYYSTRMVCTYLLGVWLCVVCTSTNDQLPQITGTAVAIAINEPKHGTFSRIEIFLTNRDNEKV